ncbi:MAG: hypothetical protein M1829_003054 [Trizodia sp. TS-e1964]|nr:MAG: hypothetical protein M1829_003054 [Trizodia sp. TS-e1964]
MEDQSSQNLTETAKGKLPDSEQREISVFAPPSSSTPQAAQYQFNESDYEPTSDHAKIHQARLYSSSRNKRLPSEAEIAASQAAASERFASVTQVDIKVRFPDQSQVVAKFTSEDTAASLYAFVRSMLVAEEEPFLLAYSAPGGSKYLPATGPDVNKKLIRGFHFNGRMLINFVWGDKTSAASKSAPILKQEFAARAAELKVEQIQAAADAEEETAKPEAKGRGKTGGMSGGMPKWLKLPGKK